MKVIDSCAGLWLSAPLTTPRDGGDLFNLRVIRQAFTTCQVQKTRGYPLRLRMSQEVRALVMHIANQIYELGAW